MIKLQNFKRTKNLDKTTKDLAEKNRQRIEARLLQERIKEDKFQEELKIKKKNDPNFRDYDKEPLIIQSYEKFFVLTLLVSSFIFAGIFAGILNELRWREVPRELLWLSLIPMSYIIIVAFFQKFKFKNHKIKFTNHYIEFYDYEKSKRQCKIIKDELARPFFTECTMKKSMPDVFFNLLMILAISLTFLSTGFLKTIYLLISFYLANLALKFIVYIFLNRSLKGFRIFPFIQVAKSQHIVSMYGALLSARYYLIYLYNDEIYKEVKKYFLQKNINIDNLPKSYNML